MKIAEFASGNSRITVDFNTYNGCPLVTVSNDGDANTEETESTIHLDNYQTYQLAMSLLKGIDVVDTRGGR